MPKEKEKKESSPAKKKFQLQLIEEMLTLATSGFGLVAALAWNNVIQELVNNYVKKFLPNNSGIVSLLIYAIVVTLLAVFVTYQLSHIKERLEKYQN